MILGVFLTYFLCLLEGSRVLRARENALITKTPSHTKISDTRSISKSCDASSIGFKRYFEGLQGSKRDPYFQAMKIAKEFDKVFFKDFAGPFQCAAELSKAKADFKAHRSFLASVPSHYPRTFLEFYIKNYLLAGKEPRDYVSVSDFVESSKSDTFLMLRILYARHMIASKTSSLGSEVNPAQELVDCFARKLKDKISRYPKRLGRENRKISVKVFQSMLHVLRKFNATVPNDLECLRKNDIDTLNRVDPNIWEEITTFSLLNELDLLNRIDVLKEQFGIDVFLIIDTPTDPKLNNDCVKTYIGGLEKDFFQDEYLVERLNYLRIEYLELRSNKKNSRANSLKPELSNILFIQLVRKLFGIRKQLSILYPLLKKGQTPDYVNLKEALKLKIQQEKYIQGSYLMQLSVFNSDLATEITEYQDAVLYFRNSLILANLDRERGGRLYSQLKVNRKDIVKIALRKEAGHEQRYEILRSCKILFGNDRGIRNTIDGLMKDLSTYRVLPVSKSVSPNSVNGSETTPTRLGSMQLESMHSILEDIKTWNLENEASLINRIKKLNDSNIDVLAIFKEKTEVPDHLTQSICPFYAKMYVHSPRSMLVLKEEIQRVFDYLKFEYLTEITSSQPDIEKLERWKAELKFLSVAILLEKLLETSPLKQHALLKPFYSNLFNYKSREFDYEKLRQFVKQELREGKFFGKKLRIEKKYFDQLRVLNPMLAGELSEYQRALISIREALEKAGLENTKLYKSVELDKGTIRKLITNTSDGDIMCKHMNNLMILFSDDSSAVEFLVNTIDSRPEESIGDRMKSSFDGLTGFLNRFI